MIAVNITTVRSAILAASLTIGSGSAIAGASITAIFSPSGLPAAIGPVNAINLTNAATPSNQAVTLFAGTANQVTVTPTGGGTYYNDSEVYPAAIVQGTVQSWSAIGGAHADPVTGGTAASPTYWTSPYVSSGLGVIDIKFASAQAYLGMLWGSIGQGDVVTFLSGGQAVASYTGAQAITSAATFNGQASAQGYGGSQYTMFNMAGGTFNEVKLSEVTFGGLPGPVPSFEAADFQFAAATQPSPAPEPSSIVLIGVGLAGIVFVRWRMASM